MRRSEKLVPWLQRVAKSSTKPRCEEYTVFIPKQKICFFDATFNANQCYILTNKEFKRLKELKVSQNEDFQEINLSQMFITDHTLTDLISLLVKKNWNVSKRELSDEKILVDSAGTLIFYTDDNKAILNDVGNSFGNDTINRSHSSFGFCDFTTRQAIKNLAEHKIINFLTSKLAKYSKDEIISLNDWFFNLQAEPITWQTTKNYLKQQGVPLRNQRQELVRDAITPKTQRILFSLFIIFLIMKFVKYVFYEIPIDRLDFTTTLLIFTGTLLLWTLIRPFVVELIETISQSNVLLFWNNNNNQQSIVIDSYFKDLGSEALETESTEPLIGDRITLD